MKALSLSRLMSYDESMLRRSAVKITHIGEQTGPVLTIVIAVYYYIPSISLFQSYSSNATTYSNDKLPYITHFTVSPHEFSRILKVGLQMEELGLNTDPSLSFTVVVDTPDGSEGKEILFGFNDAKHFHLLLDGAIDSSNGVGKKILAMQRNAAYSQSP